MKSLFSSPDGPRNAGAVEFSDFSKAGEFHIAVAVLDPAFRLSISRASTAPEHPVWVWKGRADRTLFVSCGAAWSGALADAVNLARTLPPGLCIHGARAFAPWDVSAPHLPDADDADWSGFSADHFVLPRFSIVQAPGAPAILRMVWHESGPPDFDLAWKWLGEQPPDAPANFPTAQSRWDSPDFEGWDAGVKNALRAMKRGGLHKVVLARKSWLELAAPADPYLFLSRLSERAPDCFHFAHCPRPGTAVFLGASPELLYSRKGGRIFSEALAATRPRSLDPNEEDRLGKQLLHSPKEREEHRLVVEAIAERFRWLCDEFTPEASPSILKLGRLQHLITRFEGALKPGMCDLRILETLHPTPAVCGSPGERALELILENEPFPRGLYSGPLGVVSRDFSEFCVAIRSMRIEGRLLNLYAGAGIVPGSDPEKEWSELDAKMEESARIVS